MLKSEGFKLEGMGDQKFNFSEHHHVAYQIEGDDE